MSQVRTHPHQSHHVLINKSVHARSETKSVHQHKDHEREENKEKSMYGPGSRFFLDSVAPIVIMILHGVNSLRG